MSCSVNSFPYSVESVLSPAFRYHSSEKKSSPTTSEASHLYHDGTIEQSSIHESHSSSQAGMEEGRMKDERSLVGEAETQISRYQNKDQMKCETKNLSGEDVSILDTRRSSVQSVGSRASATSQLTADIKRTPQFTMYQSIKSDATWAANYPDLRSVTLSLTSPEAEGSISSPKSSSSRPYKHATCSRLPNSPTSSRKSSSHNNDVIEASSICSSSSSLIDSVIRFDRPDRNNTSSYEKQETEYEPNSPKNNMTNLGKIDQRQMMRGVSREEGSNHHHLNSTVFESTSHSRSIHNQKNSVDEMRNGAVHESQLPKTSSREFFMYTNIDGEKNISNAARLQHSQSIFVSNPPYHRSSSPALHTTAHAPYNGLTVSQTYSDKAVRSKGMFHSMNQFTSTAAVSSTSGRHTLHYPRLSSSPLSHSLSQPLPQSLSYPSNYHTGSQPSPSSPVSLLNPNKISPLSQSLRSVPSRSVSVPIVRAASLTRPVGLYREVMTEIPTHQHSHVQYGSAVLSSSHYSRPSNMQFSDTPSYSGVTQLSGKHPADQSHISTSHDRQISTNSARFDGSINTLYSSPPHQSLQNEREPTETNEFSFREQATVPMELIRSRSLPTNSELPTPIQPSPSSTGRLDKLRIVK